MVNLVRESHYYAIMSCIQKLFFLESQIGNKMYNPPVKMANYMKRDKEDSHLLGSAGTVMQSC